MYKLCVYAVTDSRGRHLDYQATLDSFRERLDSYLESVGDALEVVNRPTDANPQAPANEGRP